MGFAFIQMENDPVMLEWERAKKAKATRLWAQFFCKSTPGNVSALIPKTWSNFFTVMLLSPANFAWTRDFLTSNAFKFFQCTNGSINFNIPVIYPANGQTLCLTEMVEGQNLAEKGNNMVDEMETTAATEATTPKNTQGRGEDREDHLFQRMR